MSHLRLKEFIEGKRDNLEIHTGYLSKNSFIFVGKDYHGSLKLPPGTEEIEIFDLTDGRQIIHYLHHFTDKKEEVRPIPFANEMRSPDNRVEISDIIPPRTVYEQPQRTM
jgi:hypothetical protein